MASDDTPIPSKCIVMPLRPAPGQPPSGVGMGLHFLLGNIIVLHSDFSELWFGWRFTKIFSDEAAFTDYAHHPDRPVDMVAVGRAQQVRYWIEGHYRVGGALVETRLVFTDAQEGRTLGEGAFTASPEDAFLGFRRDVLAWMAGFGLPFPAGQPQRALWPEPMSLAALDVFGQGLETFYRHTGYGHKGPVDTDRLSQAVDLAPDAYLPHDLLGWVRYKNDDLTGADSAFRTAVTINPDGAGAMAGLMWLGVATGNADDARKWTRAKAAACGTAIEKALAATERRLKKTTD